MTGGPIREGPPAATPEAPQLNTATNGAHSLQKYAHPVAPWDVPLDIYAAGRAILEAHDRERARWAFEVEHLRTVTSGWDGTADECGTTATALWETYDDLERAGVIRWDPYAERDHRGWRGAWVETLAEVRVPPASDEDDTARRAAYLEAAARGMLEDVAAATEGDRWRTLTRCAWRAGEIGLPIDFADKLAEASTLDDHYRQRRQYARSAWKKGTRRPREVLRYG